jgi:hypothetical protein
MFEIPASKGSDLEGSFQYKNCRENLVCQIYIVTDFFCHSSPFDTHNSSVKQDNHQNEHFKVNVLHQVENSCPYIATIFFWLHLDQFWSNFKKENLGGDPFFLLFCEHKVIS